MPITIDRPWITDTLTRLVAINSVNPDIAPDAPGEAEAAAFCAARLADLGLTVRTHEHAPTRTSVVAVRKGAGAGRSLMLNAHLDTVGVEGMDDPFGATIREGRLYARGAYDMKGAAAACMGALKALHDAGARTNGDILLSLVADEEAASMGAIDIAPRYPTDGAIVTEPTALRLCLAHKGFAWIEVETRGVAAHGSRVALGVDANMRMGRFLAKLDRLEQGLRARTPHPLVGPPSLHASTIHGGVGWSTYSDRCTLRIERRTIPGETDEFIMAEINAILEALRQEDPTFDSTARLVLARGPFEGDADAPLARTASATLQRITGAAPKVFGDTPWMDSAVFAAQGADTIILGPTGAGAHAHEEWVDLDSVCTLAQTLAEITVEYCG